LDIEGAELNVINDLIENGKIKFIQRLMIEFHPTILEISLKDFILNIEAHGFKAHIQKNSFRKKPVNVVLDCVRSSETIR
jgi:hypothetical protein